MTGLILVDESGDLGLLGSRYFTMSSIVSPSSRVLLPASRVLPKGSSEKKFYNTPAKEIESILGSLSASLLYISYISVDKSRLSNRERAFGITLYKDSLNELLDISLSQCIPRDVNVIIDGNRYIRQNELREMCENLCDKHSKNLKKCYKGISQNEPCLRLVDYVAGSVRYSFEQGDDRYIKIIDEKISVARRY